LKAGKEANRYERKMRISDEPCELIDAASGLRCAEQILDEERGRRQFLDDLPGDGSWADFWAPAEPWQKCQTWRRIVRLVGNRLMPRLLHRARALD
jgi:hypothetical protein